MKKLRKYKYPGLRFYKDRNNCNDCVYYVENWKNNQLNGIGITLLIK